MLIYRFIGMSIYRNIEVSMYRGPPGTPGGGARLASGSWGEGRTMHSSPRYRQSVTPVGLGVVSVVLLLCCFVALLYIESVLAPDIRMCSLSLCSPTGCIHHICIVFRSVSRAFFLFANYLRWLFSFRFYHTHIEL